MAIIFGFLWNIILVLTNTQPATTNQVEEVINSKSSIEIVAEEAVEITDTKATDKVLLWEEDAPELDL